MPQPSSITLKLLELAWDCAPLGALLSLSAGLFCLELSSMGIRSDDMALLSGSTSSGFTAASVLSGTLFSSVGAGLGGRGLWRRVFFTPLCCCCSALPSLEAAFFSASRFRSKLCLSFCCCCCCCCCSGLLCCCPVAAATAAALAATLEVLTQAGSFSSESDVESESESDEEACLNLWTNLSSPVLVLVFWMVLSIFRSVIESDGFYEKKKEEREKNCLQFVFLIKPLRRMEKLKNLVSVLRC